MSNLYNLIIESPTEIVTSGRSTGFGACSAYIENCPIYAGLQRLRASNHGSTTFTKEQIITAFRNLPVTVSEIKNMQIPVLVDERLKVDKREAITASCRLGESGNSRPDWKEGSFLNEASNPRIGYRGHATFLKMDSLKTQK